MSKCRKIAVLGSSLVGKSALTYQLMEKMFIKEYNPTIESTYRTTFTYNSQEYELVVTDTAGQDEFSIFPAQYLIDVHGYVLVYDILNKKSFEVISTLHDRLINITGNANVPLVLVGNKVDLDEFREVSFEDGKTLAAKWNVTFLETSAKNGDDAKKIFNALLREIERINGNVSRDGCVMC
ncbi:GTP-binding protein Rheb-like [Zophobas morio]|uniref:GTP-binding protein Rheb-like n=1 Tax=Zophobas morio TaxID=2755281 RepID=UPI003083079E